MRGQNTEFMNVTCNLLRKTTSSNNRLVPPTTKRVETKIVRSYVTREVLIVIEKRRQPELTSRYCLLVFKELELLLSSEEISTPLQLVVDGSYEKNACSDTGWTTKDTFRMLRLASCF
jgi:hypothetical protein